MSKIIHQVWIQGESNLPEKFVANRKLWQKSFPDFEMKLWDEETARAEWDDVDKNFDRCYHHATRADIILARAIRDYGGLATGTDCIPNRSDKLRHHIDVMNTMLVITPGRAEISNGLQWSQEINHPFWVCVCKHQMRDGGKHLGNPNVPVATGPQCYIEAFRARKWALGLVTAPEAFVTDWNGEWLNPDAFIHAGYAASWWGKAKGGG